MPDLRAKALALTLILLATGLLWHRQPVRSLNEFDQPFYLGIAHDLVHHHRFTDGFMFADAAPDGIRPKGMRFAPLYPALLAAAASLDPALRTGMDCVVAGHDLDETCPRAAPLIRWFQFVELAAVFWLLWWMATRTAGPAIGWLALALALPTTPLLLRSVDYLMTEMTALTLSTAATAAAIQAATHTGRRRLAWSAATGALLALTTLTRPSFLYLIPAALLATAAIGRRRAWAPLAAFTAAACLTFAPWLARNAATFGRPSLTYGYDSHTLVQRIAFDTMTWPEYAQSYLCWLPDGTSLGRRFLGPSLLSPSLLGPSLLGPSLLGPSLLSPSLLRPSLLSPSLLSPSLLGPSLLGTGGCDRFGWDDHPNSFYVLGLRHMLPETLAAAGGYSHHLAYLLTHYILRMPVWHLAVSIPLALRGAYVAHWWGFVLFWMALALTWAERPRARGPEVRQTDDAAWRPGIRLLAWPAWFMLAFNASVAVNQVRYNLMLIPLYAVAGAICLQTLARRVRGTAA